MTFVTFSKGTKRGNTRPEIRGRTTAAAAPTATSRNSCKGLQGRCGWRFSGLTRASDGNATALNVDRAHIVAHGDTNPHTKLLHQDTHVLAWSCPRRERLAHTCRWSEAVGAVPVLDKR